MDRCSSYDQRTHRALTRRHGADDKTMGGEKDIGLGLKIRSNVHLCQGELVQKMPAWLHLFNFPFGSWSITLKGAFWTVLKVNNSD